MVHLPFELPKSLASYAELFEQDPDKTIARLKQQLQKRGPDAVGHFLLAWLYHLRDENEKAIEYSLKAKTLAPGSTFFEKLHYYLSHPNRFEAWTPEEAETADARPATFEQNPAPALDLDHLIEKLSQVESEKIKPSEGEPSGPGSTLSDGYNDVDDIVSETLATIHEAQGKTDAAIRAYKRLKKLNKGKQSFYTEKISRLKKLREEQKRAEEQQEQG